MVGDEGQILDGLNLNDSAGALVLEDLQFTPTAKKPQWAENNAADGDLLVEESHYTNSYFTHKVRFIGDDMDDALALVGQLTDKLQKAERMAGQGGIPLLWTPVGLSTTYTWWPILGEYTEIPITPAGDLAGWFLAMPVLSFKLTCRPFGYLPERTVVAAVQSALPVQTVLIPDVGGDVAAEARAIVTDKAGQDRRHLEWGLDQVDGQATNLVTNPSVEINTTGWASQGAGSTVGRSVLDSYCGDASLLVTQDGSGSSRGATYNLPGSAPLAPSRAYTASVWVKGEGTGIGKTLKLLLRELTEAQAVVGEARQDFVLTAEWQRVSVTRIFGTTGVDAAILLLNVAADAFSLYVDGLVLEDSTAKLAARTLRTNLAANPYAAIDATWWELSSSGGSWTEPTLVRGNAWGLRSDGTIGPGGTAFRVFSTRSVATVGALGIRTPAKTIAVAPGETITASAYVQTINPSDSTSLNRGYRPLMQFTDAAGTLLEGDVEGEVKDEGVDGLRISISGVVPAGAAYVICYFRVVSSTAGDYVDHNWTAILIERSAGVQEYFPTPPQLASGLALWTSATNASSSVLLSAAIEPIDYFDGDSPNAAWSGVRHSSTSVRLAETLITAAKLVTAGFGGVAATRVGADGEEKVVRATAVSAPVTMCSTGDIAHVGVFKGKPRVYAVSEDARFRISYRVGHGPFYSLPWQAPPVINAWAEVDCGELTLDRLVRGPQRSEIRIDVKSVGANTLVDVNYLDMLPTLKGWGKARGLASNDATSLLAYDEFDQTGGSITGGLTANAITAITVANPGVITATAHGLANGDRVWIEAVEGTMGALINGYRTVAGVTTNTFNVGVSTVGKAYTSGGKISKGGKSLPLPNPGKWLGVGDPDDGSINAGAHTLERTAVSDASLTAGRFFLIGMDPVSFVEIAGDVSSSGGVVIGPTAAFRQGYFVRFANVNNWLMLVLQNTPLTSTPTPQLLKCLGGFVVPLAIMPALAVLQGAPRRLAVRVDTGGVWQVSVGDPLAAGSTYEIDGQDNDLAAGGSLASGLTGAYDAWITSAACTRTFDNVNVLAVPDAGRVCYANRSIEIRSDLTQRQDAAGVYWGTPSLTRDSLLYIPPEGDSGQVARLITKLRRGDNDREPDAVVTDNQETTVRIAERFLLPR